MWFILVMAGTSYGLPVFARLHKVPCSTCHSAVSRRTEFGDAFRKRGYRWPSSGAEVVPASPPIEMRGTSFFTGLLPDNLPLAVVATASVAYRNDPSLPTNVIAGTPSLNLVLGGNLAEHFSFFGTWGGSGPPSELFIQATAIANRPELNFKIGLLEQATTLFKANEALLAPFSLGTSALNGFTLSKGRLGAEANGIVFNRTFWAVGAVLNGGIGSNVDAYCHLEAKLGGMDFQGNEPDIDLDSTSLLEEFTLTVGAWGYLGRTGDDPKARLVNVRRVGLDAKLQIHRIFTLWGGIMGGFDEDLKLDPSSRSANSLAWFAEASYSITTWLIASYMYQLSDASSLKQMNQRHDAGLTFLVLENMRVRLRGSYVIDSQSILGADLQVLFAF